MSNVLSQQASKASWALFEGLFIIAALVAVFATFIAISGVDPDNPTAGTTPWLLGLNFVVVIVLATIVVREYFAIQSNSESEGRGRLARPFFHQAGAGPFDPYRPHFLRIFDRKLMETFCPGTIDGILKWGFLSFQDFKF